MFPAFDVYALAPNRREYNKEGGWYFAENA